MYIHIGKRCRIGVISLLMFAVFFCFCPSELIPVMLAAALVPEGGHLLTIRLLKAKITSFTLTPIGADIIIDRMRLTYGRESIIFLSGGLTNLLCAFLCIIGSDISDTVSYLMSANLLYAAFNLLPVRGLDGGCVMENILLLFLTPDQAERAAHAVSFVFLLFLWTVSGSVLFFSSLNSTQAVTVNGSMFYMSLFLFAAHLGERKGGKRKR